MVWFFDREAEELACEVRRTLTAYEVVLRRPDGTSTVQHADTATVLLQHLAMVPDVLLGEGWRPRAAGPWSSAWPRARRRSVSWLSRWP